MTAENNPPNQTWRSLMADDSHGVAASETEEFTDLAPGAGEATAVNYFRPQRWRLKVGVLSGLAVGVLAVVALTRQTPGALDEGDDFDDFDLDADTELFAAKKEKRPLPLPDECSKSTVQNCIQSQCCLEFHAQCFAKNATYGACMKKCDKAKLMKAGNGSWSCAKLGLERRCAKATENCADFGCCADAGHQCFLKDNSYGKCMYTCDPANMTKSGTGAWSCDPVGKRNTPYYRNDYTPHYANKTLVEPWIKNCSTIGESCAKTRCCSWTGYHCYEKNDTWASCLSACIPKKRNGGISEKPHVQKGKPVFNPPPHNKPTFKHADPGPWTCKSLTLPETPAYLDGTSHFCFTFVSNDKGKGKTHDFELIEAQQKAKTGIFACNHWVVFSDTDKQLNPGRTVVVDFPKFKKRPNTKLWVNTPVFVNVWKNIKQEGTWKKYPWIIKADVYTVFIPRRLEYVLRHQPVPSNGVYMENCQHVRMGFHGSLEVISRDAFGTLLDHLDSCQVELPITAGTHTHFKYYGEDKFAAWCMHKHGVGRIPSRQEIVSVPANQHIYGLHLTQTCPDHKQKLIQDKKSKKKFSLNCSRVLTAGLHGFLKVKPYMKCLHETMQAELDMES